MTSPEQVEQNTKNMSKEELQHYNKGAEEAFKEADAEDMMTDEQKQHSESREKIMEMGKEDATDDAKKDVEEWRKDFGDSE